MVTPLFAVKDILKLTHSVYISPSTILSVSTKKPNLGHLRGRLRGQFVTGLTLPASTGADTDTGSGSVPINALQWMDSTGWLYCVLQCNVARPEVLFRVWEVLRVNCIQCPGIHGGMYLEMRMIMPIDPPLAAHNPSVLLKEWPCVDHDHLGMQGASTEVNVKGVLSMRTPLVRHGSNVFFFCELELGIEALETDKEDGGGDDVRVTKILLSGRVAEKYSSLVHVYPSRQFLFTNLRAKKVQHSVPVWASSSKTEIFSLDREDDKDSWLWQEADPTFPPQYKRARLDTQQNEVKDNSNSTNDNDYDYGILHTSKDAVWTSKYGSIIHALCDESSCVSVQNAGMSEWGKSKESTMIPASVHFPLVSHEGTITSIHAAARVVELDHGKMLLLFTHYSLEDLGIGIRVGARIKVRFGHPIVCNGAVTAIGLCHCAQVSIVSFSKIDSPFIPFVFSQSAYCAMYVNLVSFYDVCWLLQAYGHCKRAFGTDISWLGDHGPLLKLGAAHGLKEGKRDIYMEMLNHSDSCILASMPTKSYTRLTSIRELLYTSRNCRFSPSEGEGEGEGSRVNLNDKWSVKPLDPSIGIFGMLKGRSDGDTVRLWDFSGSIDCLIPTVNLSHSDHPWFLRGDSVEMVNVYNGIMQPSLSVGIAIAVTSKPSSTYLQFEISDATCVATVNGEMMGRKHRFSIEEAIAHVSSSSVSYRFMYLLVVDRQPLTESQLTWWSKGRGGGKKNGEKDKDGDLDKGCRRVECIMLFGPWQNRRILLELSGKHVSFVSCMRPAMPIMLHLPKSNWSMESLGEWGSIDCSLLQVPSDASLYNVVINSDSESVTFNSIPLFLPPDSPDFAFLQKCTSRLRPASISNMLKMEWEHSDVKDGKGRRIPEQVSFTGIVVGCHVQDNAGSSRSGQSQTRGHDVILLIADMAEPIQSIELFIRKSRGDFGGAIRTKGLALGRGVVIGAVVNVWRASRKMSGPPSNTLRFAASPGVTFIDVVKISTLKSSSSSPSSDVFHSSDWVSAWLNGNTDVDITIDTPVNVSTSSASQSVTDLLSLSKIFRSEVDDLAITKADSWTRRPMDRRYYRIRGILSNIVLVGLKWQCNNCLECGTCSCGSASTHQLRANISAMLEDGNTSAFITAFGADTVWNLLGFSQMQRRTYADAAVKHGKVEYRKGEVLSDEGVDEVFARFADAIASSVPRDVIVHGRIKYPDHLGRSVLGEGMRVGGGDDGSGSGSAKNKSLMAAGASASVLKIGHDQFRSMKYPMIVFDVVDAQNVDCRNECYKTLTFL